MSEPTPSRWRRVLAALVLFGPPVLRLALVLFALGLLYQGARMIYEPAGYLVLGSLLWLEVSRRTPGPSGGPEGS